MSVRTPFFSYTLASLIVLLFCQNVALAANGISLYTPYTNISVPPGESIDYTIDVINNGSSIKDVDISLSGIPKEWEYTLKSGGWTINQVSVLPGEKKTISLKVNVPLKVDKGIHKFKVIARNFGTLPLVVEVSEQGTYKTEFTSEQANMQGHAKSTFTFQTELKNHTGEKQLYSLRANARRGWNVIFKPNYKQATAVEIDANATSKITVEIKPPHNIEAGSYKIPVQAVTSSTSAAIELEVVITGSYEMELTTPNGLLSTSITAGSEKRIELLLRNTGSSALNNIRFSSSKPKNWDVTFKPDTVIHLDAGGSVPVFATIIADDKAIPGDYVANITAQTPEASSKAAFRISVKTPLLWGWLGVLIIAGALGSVYYLVQKYGRR